MSEQKRFISDAGNAALLAAMVGLLVFGRATAGFSEAASKGVDVGGLLKFGIGVALVMTLVGALVAVLGLGGKVPSPSRGKTIFALALNGIALVATASVSLAMWTMSQPPRVESVPAAGALLPGLVPASDEQATFDAAAGERMTSKGPHTLTVRWEGPVDADMEAEPAEMFRALYGDAVQGQPEAVVAGGHEAIRLGLQLEGHRGALASWRCPVSRRRFTLLSLGPGKQSARAYLDDAIGQVACHGHGSVAFPEARWTPPAGWQDAGVVRGIHWFYGPDQNLGIAAMALAEAEAFVNDCPADLGQGLALELKASGNTIEGPSQPLATGCGATVEVTTPVGTRETARIEVRLCDHIPVRIFHMLAEGAEPHDPADMTCVVVAEG